jgi:hypothetical protein
VVIPYRIEVDHFITVNRADWVGNMQRRQRLIALIFAVLAHD